MKLREWQKTAYKKLLMAGGKDFFLEATPGAGKTKFACHVASEKIKTGEVDRIIIVVPTTSLKEQWADDLHLVGIDAEPKHNEDSWPDGFKAVCVTYQQVGNDAAKFRYMSKSKTMVVLDEIHHCADDERWGESIAFAFELATFRLELSGTPFRSDNSSIPFLRYKDGKAEPHEIYGYGEALRDQICRHVFFPRQGGRMEWSTPQGRVLSKTFDDELSEQHANQRLRTALTTGEWITDTIRDAGRLLDELRADDPDAAGLVIAIDQFHANAIRRKMAQVLGVEADCVISDDPDSQTKLTNFRESKRPWIIAVKMVSEGVDIPRLRVGIYATTTKTEMFFRQAVGRFVRIEENHDDPTASVFIPDDARLRAYAEEIRRQRIHQLEEELQEEAERRRRSEEEDNSDVSFFMPLNSTAENKGTIIDDTTFTREQLEEAGKIADGKCKPEIAAGILLRSGYFSSQIESRQAKQPVERKADVRRRLRESNNKLAKSIAFATGREHSHINAELNSAVGIKSVTNATVEQLERRLAAAQEYIARHVETVRER